jgi:type I restriction enzyme, S subunit
MENKENMDSTIKRLNFITFKILEKWFVSYYVNPHILKSKYDFVKLKSLIVPVKDKIRLSDFRNDFRVVKKISFSDGSIFLREENETKMDLYKLYPNDLLISKINFHQGALAINKYKTIVCTTHYQPYKINRDLINDEYLTLYLRCKPFQNYIDYLRADGIKNEATYEFIGDLEIPLPSIDEQIRIVKAYNEKIEQAKNLEKDAKVLENEIEDYLYNKLGVVQKVQASKNKSSFLDFINYQDIERWALSYIYKNQMYSFKKVKYEIKPIKAILNTFDGGKTPSTSNKDYWCGNVNWFSAKDMKSLNLKKSEDKITAFAVTDARMKVHPAGTILGVFRSGILRHSFPVAILEAPATINQDLKAMSFDNKQIDNQYALYYMHLFQKLILEQAQKTGVTVESINTDEFMEIPVVLPPLNVQDEIKKRIHEMKNYVDEQKSKSQDLIIFANKEFEKEIFGV